MELLNLAGLYSSMAGPRKTLNWIETCGQVNSFLLDIDHFLALHLPDGILAQITVHWHFVI